jgi:multidrug efflux pump subunit AcrA (membrane-fusion protein)
VHLYDKFRDPGGIGGYWLPEKARSGGRRAANAGLAGADGDGDDGAGGAKQRVCCHHQVAPVDPVLPQVSGQLTDIRVHSGDQVKAGQLLMEIDARQQRATVDSLRATEQQKKALDDYDTVEVDRQRKLFEAGVTSRDAYEQAQQAFQNAKADYQSAVEARKAGEQLLATMPSVRHSMAWWATFRFTLGDYVSQNQSPATILTTIDDNSHLEAYIYIPTERAGEVHQGLAVNLTDNSGKVLEKTRIDFVSRRWTARCREFW